MSARGSILSMKKTEDLSNGPSTDVRIEDCTMKQYNTLVTEQVQKNLYALKRLQDQSAIPIREYHQTVESIKIGLCEKSKSSKEQMLPWIEGQLELSIQEQMQYVTNRWNPSNKNAKYKGVPCFWARVLKRLPFYEATEEELKVMSHIKMIDVMKLPLEACQNGLIAKYQIAFQYNENEYINYGSVVLLSYNIKNRYPLHEFIEPTITIIRENDWKKPITYENKEKLHFFDAFKDGNKRKQFIFFYTLATEAGMNPMEWFNDYVLQKKCMDNLICNTIKEFDYTNDMNIEDKASLACVQQ